MQPEQVNENNHLKKFRRQQTNMSLDTKWHKITLMWKVLRINLLHCFYDKRWSHDGICLSEMLYPNTVTSTYLHYLFPSKHRSDIMINWKITYLFVLWYNRKCLCIGIHKYTKILIWYFCWQNGNVWKELYLTYVYIDRVCNIQLCELNNVRDNLLNHQHYF